MRVELVAMVTGIGLAAPPAAASQSLSLTVSRWLPAPHVSDYRIGVSRTSLGPLVLFPMGQVLLGGGGMTLVARP